MSGRQVASAVGTKIQSGTYRSFDTFPSAVVTVPRSAFVTDTRGAALYARGRHYGSCVALASGVTERSFALSWGGANYGGRDTTTGALITTVVDLTGVGVDTYAVVIDTSSSV